MTSRRRVLSILFLNVGILILPATNMMQPNQFPPPYCLVAQGIMVLLDRDTTDEAVASFEHNVVGELRMLGKVFAEFPMSLVTARADVDQLVNRETHEATEFVTAKLWKIDPFLYIPPLCQFDVQLKALPSWDIPKFVRIRFVGWLDGFASSVKVNQCKY